MKRNGEISDIKYQISNIRLCRNRRSTPIGADRAFEAEFDLRSSAFIGGSISVIDLTFGIWPLTLAALLLCAVPSLARGDTATATPKTYPGKYVLASLALPGAGEMLKGSRGKGEVFLWTDAAIWLTYGGLTIVGNAGNTSAKLFARRFSGASATAGSDEYYVNLERYDNSEQYNEDVRRDAREIYHDSAPDKQKQYAESHSYTGALAWDWGSDSLRYTYWYQRRNARSVLHAAGFFVGAALLNRIVSAVDVAFFTADKDEAVRRHSGNSQLAARHSSLVTRLGAAPLLDRPGLALIYRF